MSPARVEPWREEDLGLLQVLMGEAAMTVHLGGPETPEKVTARHTRYRAAGPLQPSLRVVDASTGAVVGWVGLWETQHRGETVLETGWAIVPAARGRGLAKAATRPAIAWVRERGRREPIHAFPKLENAASNAVCRALGFEDLGAFDGEYPAGNPIRCRDWRLLAAPES